MPNYHLSLQEAPCLARRAELWRLRSPLWEDSIPCWVPGVGLGRVLTLGTAGGLESGTAPNGPLVLLVGPCSGSLHVQ